jgi:hypothetical protein
MTILPYCKNSWKMEITRCSQDGKKREFKMGVIALQNTELSFGFARIQ